MSGTGTKNVTGAEAVDDAPFLEVIRRHLYSHAVTGEDADLIHTHAAGQMTEELVSFRFLGGDLHSEGRVGIAFLNRTDELDDILGHGKETR